MTPISHAKAVHGRKKAELRSVTLTRVTVGSPAVLALFRTRDFPSRPRGRFGFGYYALLLTIEHKNLTYNK